MNSITTELDDLTRQANSGWGGPPGLVLNGWRAWEPEEMVRLQQPLGCSNRMNAKITKVEATFQVKELWNMLVYKIEVLAGLQQRLKAELAIKIIEDSLEQLNKVKEKYVDTYDSLPPIQDPNRNVMFTIVNMIKRLGDAILVELKDQLNEQLKEDLRIITERIRTFWRSDSMLLGTRQVPPPCPLDANIIEYYEVYFFERNKSNV